MCINEAQILWFACDKIRLVARRNRSAPDYRERFVAMTWVILKVRPVLEEATEYRMCRSAFGPLGPGALWPSTLDKWQSEDPFPSWEISNEGLSNTPPRPGRPLR